MTMPSLDPVVARAPLLWRTLLAILVLAGSLVALVQSRAGILRGGTEVRLQTVPVDPRDLFRGDYVVLAYEIGVVESSKLAGEPAFRRGDSVHVRLAPGADGYAQAVGLSRAKPTPAPGETIVAGRVMATNICALGPDGASDCPRDRNALRIAYGIESYFVPQGSGRDIERTERKRIEIVAAVSAGGDAAIKRLLIDGKLVHAEPPY